jgi:hypothetical protein
MKSCLIFLSILLKMLINEILNFSIKIKSFFLLDDITYIYKFFFLESTTFHKLNKYFLSKFYYIYFIRYYL